MSLFENKSSNKVGKTNIKIQKDYFTVNEVAELWSVPLEDIRYLAEEGKLSVCVRKTPLRSYVENVLSDLSNFPPQPNIKTSRRKIKTIVGLLDSPQPLHQSDLYKIFANPNKKVEITRFKTRPIMNIIKSLGLEIEVGFDDMIITASEIKRFQFELNSQTARTKTIKNPLKILAKDFSLINLYGEEFRFGEKQATIIKHLYERHCNNDPYVSGKRLIQIANSESYFLGNLFNGHPGWRKVIVPGKRGFYKINLPSEDTRLSIDKNEED